MSRVIAIQADPATLDVLASAISDWRIAVDVQADPLAREPRQLGRRRTGEPQRDDLGPAGPRDHGRLELRGQLRAHPLERAAHVGERRLEHARGLELDGHHRHAWLDARTDGTHAAHLHHRMLDRLDDGLLDRQRVRALHHQRDRRDRPRGRCHRRRRRRRAPARDRQQRRDREAANDRGPLRDHGRDGHDCAARTRARSRRAPRLPGSPSGARG